jgi:hypothetical protein
MTHPADGLNPNIGGIHQEEFMYRRVILGGNANCSSDDTNLLCARFVLTCSMMKLVHFLVVRGRRNCEICCAVGLLETTFMHLHL